MRIAYLDESGTPELKGRTSHFVLLAVVIDGADWKRMDSDVLEVKREFGLENAEIHSGWIARRYVEQERVTDFAKLGHEERLKQATEEREKMLLKRGAVKGLHALKSMRKNFSKTLPYLHLTFDERHRLLARLCETVAAWEDCVLLAECIDKSTFGGVPPRVHPFEEAFDQVVSRFHYYLSDVDDHGMIVQDQNPTHSDRLTSLMRAFHSRGTRWTVRIPRLIETPLFVDSRLTSMVQMADLCAYATRRYLENSETALFDHVFPRFRQVGGRCVGVRHYRGTKRCDCRICANH